MKDWQSYEKAADKGPLQITIKVILATALVVVLLWGIGLVFGFFNSAVNVAKEEFGPREVLKKYEWFKNVSAELDKKTADIQVYHSRVEAMEQAYSGVARKDWPSSDREQLSVWLAEESGVKAGYNSLAAEYNSNMSKFNWQFANAGRLPQGATVALPKEYKTYTTGDMK